MWENPRLERAISLAPSYSPIPDPLANEYALSDVKTLPLYESIPGVHASVAPSTALSPLVGSHCALAGTASRELDVYRCTILQCAVDMVTSLTTF